MDSAPSSDPRVAHPVFGDRSVSLRLYPHNELTATEIVDHLCAQAALGATVGFDGVMTSEHHGGFAGYLPNPLQVTGFQLGSMERGWAAPCPLLLPLRPLGLLAEEVAWLAARFPERVGVGVAPGALALDFEAMDVDQSTSMATFRDGLPRLSAMLAGRDLGVLSGDRALMRCAAHPVPVISTAMSPAAVRRAAAAGAGVLYDGGTVIDRVRALTDAYVDAGGTGPRILIRRVWLGPPPRAAFGAQLEVYRSYSSADAMAHWRDDGWICHDDPDVLAREVVDALVDSGSTCVNLRLHAPGVDAAAATDQIGMLGREVVPRIRAALDAARSGPPGS